MKVGGFEGACSAVEVCCGEFVEVLCAVGVDFPFKFEDGQRFIEVVVIFEEEDGS